MKISAIKNVITTKKIKTLAPALTLGLIASCASSANTLKNNSQPQLATQHLNMQNYQKQAADKFPSEKNSLGLSGALAITGLAFFVGSSLLAEKNRQNKDEM